MTTNKRPSQEAMAKAQSVFGHYRGDPRLEQIFENIKETYAFGYDAGLTAARTALAYEDDPSVSQTVVTIDGVRFQVFYEHRFEYENPESSRGTDTVDVLSVYCIDSTEFDVMDMYRKEPKSPSERQEPRFYFPSRIEQAVLDSLKIQQENRQIEAAAEQFAMQHFND